MTGTATHIFVLVPFGGEIRTRNLTRFAIRDGYDDYIAGSGAGDTRSHLIDLYPRAQRGVKGASSTTMPLNMSSGQAPGPTAESCDGTHPLDWRHGELAAMVALEVAGSLHRSETLERSGAANTVRPVPPGISGRSGVLPATSALIQWQGRTVRDEVESSVSWDWLGTSFTITVGYPAPTYLSATFDLSALPNATHARLSVAVSSGGPNNGYVIPHTQVSLHPQQSGLPVLLAGGLWSAGATVHVTSNVSPDYMGGPIRLLSLESDGTFEPTVGPRVNRTILIIGDSITAASNLNRQSGDPTFGIPAQGTCADSGLYSDYSLSYMAQLCRAFDAQCTTVAVGGKGMLMNCCDKGATMPDYFSMEQKSDGKPTYNFPVADAPDAVIINLGTNGNRPTIRYLPLQLCSRHFDFKILSNSKSCVCSDWSGCTKYSADKCGPEFQSAFTEQYISFMRNITLRWPQKSIKFFAGVGPIIDEYGASVGQAVAQAVAIGINATVVDMRACPADQPPKS